MPPVASIVVQGAGVVLLVATAGLLVLGLRAGRTGARAWTRLEIAQTAAIACAAVGLGLRSLIASDVLDAVWVVGVFATIAIALLRWRRREPLLPSWF